MRLSPREVDKLALAQAAHLAQKRLASGIRLNHPEATALLANQILELIREGSENGDEQSVAQIVEKENDVSVLTLPQIAEEENDVEDSKPRANPTRPLCSDILYGIACLKHLGAADPAGSPPPRFPPQKARCSRSFQ